MHKEDIIESIRGKFERLSGVLDERVGCGTGGKRFVQGKAGTETAGVAAGKAQGEADAFGRHVQR